MLIRSLCKNRNCRVTGGLWMGKGLAESRSFASGEAKQRQLKSSSRHVLNATIIAVQQCNAYPETCAFFISSRSLHKGAIPLGDWCIDHISAARAGHFSEANTVAYCNLKTILLGLKRAAPIRLTVSELIHVEVLYYWASLRRLSFKSQTCSESHSSLTHLTLYSSCACVS